jgi:hypothetical protein
VIRQCAECTRRVPDLLGFEGEYCSASCRFIAEFESGVEFMLPHDRLCQLCGRVIVVDGWNLAVRHAGRLVCAEHWIDPAVLRKQAADARERRTLKYNRLRYEARLRNEAIIRAQVAA